MFNARQYLDVIAETPNEQYRNLNQATIDSQWDDTTQIYSIKEQKAFPFEDEYIEYDAWIDNVSDNLVNTSKNYSDFVNILYRDINHKQNYKGQYYKINLDGEHEEIYLCYDRINKLNQIPEFKCVRCNNVLTFMGEYNNPIEIPCYLGEDISSTNNLISKDGITPNSRMVIFTQYNDYTKNIKRNQRFMFQHNTAFKVEEVDKFIREQGTDGNITFIKIYVDFSAILPQDNVELNLCNYNVDYSIFIKDEKEIHNSNDSKGVIQVDIFDKDNQLIELPIIWKSSNEDVVTIDELGEYHIVGKEGESATITVCLQDNELIQDTVDIYVETIHNINQSIIVSPNNVTELFINQSIEFKCGAYIGGQKQNKDIVCRCKGVPTDKYDLSRTLDGYKITSLGYYKNPLTIDFMCDGYPTTTIILKLKRAF